MAQNVAHAELAALTRGYPFSVAAGACALWAAQYALVRAALQRQSSVFANRLVSIVHALVAMAMCTLALPRGSLRTELGRVGSRSSPAEEAAIAISLGYFVYDTACCLSIGEREAANNVHHVVSIAGLAAGLFSHRCAAELVLALLLVEVSNPFLHVRSLLAELNLKSSLLYTLSEAGFLIAYTLGRMVLGPVLMYYTLQSPLPPPAIKVGAVGLQLVSVFWFREILAKASNKLGLHRARSKQRRGSKNPMSR
jgi:hypothetical protein